MGCHVIGYSRGGMAGSSISVDLFQHGSEADDSLFTFTCVCPSNVMSNYGTNVLMGMQNKVRGGATWSNIPGGGTQFNF